MKRRGKKKGSPMARVSRYLELLSRGASARRKAILRSARIAMQRLYGR